MTQTRISSRAPMPVPADATFANEPATALRAGMAASSPLLRNPAPPAQGSGRKWAIGVAVAAALAVSAWALRSDLPFMSAPTAGTAPASSAPATQLAAADTGDAATAAPATSFAAASGYGTPTVRGRRHPVSGSDDYAAEDQQIFDSLWLADVPDEALDPDNYDYAAASYASAPGVPPPAYAPVVYYPPYAVPAVPVAYYAPSPWRFGFGLSLGLGAGWWAANYYPVYVGPVIAGVYTWSRPLPGAIVPGLPAGTTPGLANRPLPGTSTPTAAPPTLASRPVAATGAVPNAAAHALSHPVATAVAPHPATAAAVAGGRAGSGHGFAKNSEAFTRQPAGATSAGRPQSGLVQRNARMMQARREQLQIQRQQAQQMHREQTHEAQVARAEARQEQQRVAAEKRAAVRRSRPHPRPERH